MKPRNAFLLAFGVTATMLAPAQDPMDDFPPFTEPDCYCQVETQYVPGSGPIPPCVTSFGMTYSVDQLGWCAGCMILPTDPAQAYCTVSAVLTITEDPANPCNPEMSWVTEEMSEHYPEPFDCPFLPDGTSPNWLQMSCGHEVSFQWVFNRRDCGTTYVRCLDCPNPQGN